MLLLVLLLRLPLLLRRRRLCLFLLLLLSKYCNPYLTRLLVIRLTIINRQHQENKDNSMCSIKKNSNVTPVVLTAIMILIMMLLLAMVTI